MLQRIQSLYLLIAALAIALLFFVTIYQVETTTEPITRVSMSVTTVAVIQSDSALTAPPQFQLFPFSLNMILITLIIITIFWYKNRIQQNLLTKLCILLNSGLIVLLLLSTDKLKAMVMSTTFTAAFKPGIILPLISLVLLFLAGRSIMKDEALVKSADRLR